MTTGDATRDRDEVDDLVAAWRRERPDLDVAPLEVLSRVSRLARHLDRARGQAFSRHSLEGWEFDVLAALRRSGEPYELSPGKLLQQTLVTGEAVHLTPIEYQLLRYMMSMPDRPISKDMLFQHVWGYDMAGGTNLVEVAMRRLREKIEEDPSQPVYLLTVRGAGYKFNSEGNSPKMV